MHDVLGVLRPEFCYSDRDFKARFVINGFAGRGIPAGTRRSRNRGREVRLITNVEGVMLDLDGTLLDHEKASASALLESCRRWFPKQAVPDDEILGEWSRLEHIHMDRYLMGEISFQEQRRERLRGLMEWIGTATLLPMPDEEVDSMFARYLEVYERSWSPYPDVAETVEWLWHRFGELVVLSNGDREQQERKIHSLQVPRPIELFVPSDLGAAKPLEASFRRVCELKRWEPSRVLYVGDRLETDALASERAGLIGCWLDRDNAGVDKGEVRGIRRIVTLLDIPSTLQGLTPLGS
jgi:putative hydrolase of the HAD superfamily